MAQLYPQARGSIFIATYYSQGYSGGIRIHLHMGISLDNVKVTLRLAVYRPSVRLRVTPFQTRDHRFLN
jgi:hypothetical protein